MNQITKRTIDNYDKDLILDLMDMMIINKAVDNDKVRDLLVSKGIIGKNIKSLQTKYIFMPRYNPPVYYLNLSRRGKYGFLQLEFNENEIPEIIEYLQLA